MPSCRMAGSREVPLPAKTCRLHRQRRLSTYFSDYAVLAVNVQEQSELYSVLWSVSNQNGGSCDATFMPLESGIANVALLDRRWRHQLEVLPHQIVPGPVRHDLDKDTVDCLRQFGCMLREYDHVRVRF